MENLKEIRIEKIQRPEDMDRCALMMAGSEPWLTLGRGYAEILLRKTSGPMAEFRSSIP